MLWKGKVEKWSLDIVMKDNDDDDFVLAIIYICICNSTDRRKFSIRPINPWSVHVDAIAFLHIIINIC